MKEIFICSYDKHNIFLVEKNDAYFYMAVPKDFPVTNISIFLQEDNQEYILNNNLEKVIDKLNNLYKDLDSYDITLVLPVFFDNTLNTVVNNNEESFKILDLKLANIINCAYEFLLKNEIKVESKVYIFENNKYNDFLKWFLNRYQNRVEIKNLLEYVKDENFEKTYNVIDTPNINFVVGKNNEEGIKDKELNYDAVDDAITDIIERNENKEIENTKKEANGGYASYWFLGIVTIFLSFIILTILVN